MSIRQNPIFVLLIFRPFVPKIGHVSSDFEETCLTGYCLFYALRACFNNHFPTFSLRPLERLFKVHFEIILIKSLLFRNSALGSKLFAIKLRSSHSKLWLLQPKTLVTKVQQYLKNVWDTILRGRNRNKMGEKMCLYHICFRIVFIDCCAALHELAS